MKTQIPTKRQIDDLLKKATKKYRLIILLMTDLGLRVNEVTQLQLKAFNFHERTLTIQNKKQSRTLPLTDRVFEALTIYWSNIPSKEPEAYLFPPSLQSNQKHLSRKTIYKRIQKYSNGTLTPQSLRNYFAHQIVNQTKDLATAQKLLGHTSPKTTQSYLQIPQEELHFTIKNLEPRTSKLRTLLNKLRAKPKIEIIPMQHGLTNYHIGRKAEIQQLAEAEKKKINLLILGPMGIGKSHLLDNHPFSKCIRIDDFRYPKRVLGGLLLELFNGDKETIMEILLGTTDESQVQKIATKESAKRLCELAIQVTQPIEYTLVIDDLTDLTKMGVRMIEKLKNHFHIIAAARYIKIDYATFLSNFDRLELQPLSRSETTELITRLSDPLLPRIEDFEAYKNRIWEDTQGNPLFVIEMIERLSKETRITVDATQNIKHTAAKKEIDFSVPLVVAISSLLVLRYLGNEMGENAGALRLIGGIALVVAFFSRRIFKALQRKYF